MHSASYFMMALDPNPLNRYLLDIKTTKVLCSLYKSCDKEELTGHEHLMKGYFGELNSEKDFLESIKDDEW